MRIAVASDGDNVSSHFGHCESFKVFDVEDNQIVAQSSITNPEHKHGFLPKFLDEHQVNVVIAGGMGAGAISGLGGRGIETITGITGNAVQAANSYIKGELSSSGLVCTQHGHAHSCGGH